MSLTSSLKAYYAAQSILGNVAEARLEDFEYFENNPQQALSLLSLSKKSANKIFQAIPIGQEAEYIDIVKRAWGALKLPPESEDYNLFIKQFEVSGIQQVVPQRRFLNGKPTSAQNTNTTKFIAFLVIFFVAIIPLASWIGDRNAFFGMATLVVYVWTFVRFMKKANRTSTRQKSVNIPPSSSKKVENRPENLTEKPDNRNGVGETNSPERLIPLEKREARYDRKEDRRSYRKG